MPFHKGQSGNPAGRPPKAVEDAQRSVLRDLFDAAAERNVVMAQIREAEQGSTTAATWLWDRTYGKPKDAVTHDGTIRYIVEYTDPAAPAAPTPGPVDDPSGSTAV